MADFSLVGQWQTDFHNVSVDMLDGATFHSTSIADLAFFHDGGESPTPSPANANTAWFVAQGRLNLKGEDSSESGWTLFVGLADRGEPGKNDSIQLSLVNPASVNAYVTTFDFPSDASIGIPGPTVTKRLASGNLQIHSVVK